MFNNNIIHNHSSQLANERTKVQVNIVPRFNSQKLREKEMLAKFGPTMQKISQIWGKLENPY